MHPSFRLLPFALAIAAFAPFSVAYADDDRERENLARLEHELALLTREVRAARGDAPTRARIHFQYEDLARDLEMIRAGIADHLSAPRQPRPVEPLKGDYRR
ncbi:MULTISPECIES: RAQPRD family integrative conjugative element protein [Aromatoleum]|uniref:Conjugal transfer protein n=1 Tax=Aromatoleum anaerobium TaxID=182180 RepID=A0ABX1PR11_9RHOO|nr:MULTISPECIES: RAQPRD family integrative conjugative element protein [Aromatoleum]MCK0508625.1 RAQPRD family integrative conjugative element protein [Aromatoleum anaerobium]